jgi:hypothetical protein
MPPDFRGEHAMESAATVAKKKPGPKPKDDGPREALIAVRCRPPFKEWVEAFAKRERVTPSQLVEHGLVELAKVRGVEPPPDR